MKNKLTAVRYLAYFLEMIIFGAAQSVPSLFPEFFGTKPFLLLSLALAVCAREEFIFSTVFAAACGIFADLSSAGVVGYFAVTFILVCCSLKSLTSAYLNPTLFAFAVGSAAATVLILSGYFIIFRLLPGLSDPWTLFAGSYLPRMLLTFAAALPLYYLNMFLHKSLGGRGAAQ